MKSKKENLALPYGLRRVTGKILHRYCAPKGWALQFEAFRTMWCDSVQSHALTARDFNSAYKLVRK